MQVVTITGNVGRDAEVRPAGNTTVCNFSVACSERGRSGEADTTTWYRVSVFGRRGEGIAPYIRKGTRVTVTGRLSLKLYTGGDGAPNIDADVVAEEIDFFNVERADRGAAPAASAAPAAAADVYDEDIPF